MDVYEAVLRVPRIDVRGLHAEDRHPFDLELVDLHAERRGERLERAVGGAVALLHELFPLGVRRRRGVGQRHERHRRDRVAQRLAGGGRNRNVRARRWFSTSPAPALPVLPIHETAPHPININATATVSPLCHAFPLIPSGRSADLNPDVSTLAARWSRNNHLRRRRGAISPPACFILAWLAAQLAYPFVTKFDLHPFRYQWAPLSWGMYANPNAEYQVTLYRLGPDGAHTRDIAFDDDVSRGTPWSRALTQGETSAIRRIETLREVEIVLRRVAERNRDGATYVGSVDWYYLQEGRSVVQEIRIQAPR